MTPISMRTRERIALWTLRAAHLGLVVLMAVVALLTLIGMRLRDYVSGQLAVAIVGLTVASNIVNRGRCPASDLEHAMLKKYDHSLPYRRFMARIADRLGLKVKPIVYPVIFYLVSGVGLLGYFIK